MSSVQPRLSHPKYRPDIDGLRAIAVLSVVAFHAFPGWMKGGFVGVDVFFVISGYLISTIIFENLDRNTFSFAEFYARRVRRIFPALLLVLAASYTFGWFVLFAGEYMQLGKHIAAGASFISNIVLWNEAGYFDNSAETKPLLHLWSLGIEEQFYIVWPLFLWLAWRFKFNLLAITALIAILSFYLNVAGVQKDAVAAFYSPLTRFWELLCGSVLAWVSLYKSGALAAGMAKLDGWLSSAICRERPEADGMALLNLLSLFGLFLVAVSVWQIDKELRFPGKWAIVPVLGAVLIILAGPKAWVNRKVLTNKVAVWFGLISFPLYLWHWPLFSFARIVEREVPGPHILIAAVFLSIVLAWLTYKLVERPLRLGNHGNIKVVALAVLMSFVGFVGYNTYIGNGLGSRNRPNISMDEEAIKEDREKYWAGSLENNFAGAATKILVYGDSQGFDIFKSLRNDENLGVKIFQISHECTSFNLPKSGLMDRAGGCQDAFDSVMTSPELKVADTFLYSIYWQKDSEPAQAFENYKDVVAKIRLVNPKVNIVFFGPKPLLGKEWVSINTIARGRKALMGMNEFLNRVMWIMDVENEYVKELSSKLGVRFVDVSEVFCLNGCEFYIDGMFTHFDQNHWTEFGAKIFLDKLNRSQGYKNVLVR
jgi:peptidoglycan/LPS O-acetylase OafA/YrhL